MLTFFMPEVFGSRGNEPAVGNEQGKE